MKKMCVHCNKEFDEATKSVPSVVKDYKLCLQKKNRKN